MKSNTSIAGKGILEKGFSSLEDFFSFYMPGIIIMILMIVMCTEICLRWIFKTSMMGVVEIVESAMVVITFASLAGIQREKGHVRMNLLVDRLSGKKSGLILDSLTEIYSFFICAVLIYPCISVVINFRQNNEITEYISIPLWIVGTCMPLGFLFLCIRLMSQAVGDGRKLFRNIDEPGV